MRRIHKLFIATGSCRTRKSISFQTSGDSLTPADCSFRVADMPELGGGTCEDGGDPACTGLARRQWPHGGTHSPDSGGSVFVVFRISLAATISFQLEHQNGRCRGRRNLRSFESSASYGYFQPGSPTWSDVTDKVKAQVAKGQLEISANNDLAGDDPAPNVIKRLRVDYFLNGQPQSEVANEDEVLTLPASAMVTNAVYGKFSGQSKTVDLTEALASLAVGGRLNVRADNNLPAVIQLP